MLAFAFLTKQRLHVVATSLTSQTTVVTELRMQALLIRQIVCLDRL